MVGRCGNRPLVARVLRRLGLTEDRRRRLIGSVTRNLPRMVIGAKAVDIAAVPTFLAAGLAGIPYRRFVGWVASASAARAVLLLGVGVLFGREAADLLKSPGTAIALTVGLAVAVGGVHLFVRRWAGRRFRLTTV